MNRVMAMLLCFVMTLGLCACGSAAQVSGDAPITIEYGSSALYTEREMDRAIEKIRAEFDNWEGCQLHSVSYAGDDCNSQENIDWLNSLRDGHGFTQCMEFVSSFHSPKEQVGAWEPDKEYTDWQWWLASTPDGDWELVTWGY